MSGKEQFIKLPREVLESEAWHAQSINCRRFIDFLMLEHMRQGGRENGKLAAPRRQLCAFGINNGDRATDAINEAERLGLVTVKRGDRRRANTYELTWLRLFDGTAASMKYLEFRADEPAVLRDKAPSPLRDNPPSKPPKSLRDNPPSLSRYSCQGGDISKEEERYRSEDTAAAWGAENETPASAPPGKPNGGEVIEPELDPTRTCGRYVLNGTGHRVCGRPSVVGTDRCPEHALRVVNAR